MTLREGVDRLRGKQGTAHQLTTGKITTPRSGKNEWRKIKLYFTLKSILILNISVTIRIKIACLQDQSLTGVGSNRMRNIFIFEQCQGRLLSSGSVAVALANDGKVVRSVFSKPEQQIGCNSRWLFRQEKRRWNQFSRLEMQMR